MNSTQSKINHTANHWLTDQTYKIENQLPVQCFMKLNRCSEKEIIVKRFPVNNLTTTQAIAWLTMLKLQRMVDEKPVVKSIKYLIDQL